jgi:hypothetical protein
MSQVVIFRQSNNRVAILTPVLNTGLTIEEIAAKDVPSGCEYQIVNTSDIPTDSTFFDAWEYSMPISVNVHEAHESQKNKWRQVREPILKRLDVEFMRALELGQPTDEIVSKKQLLRDVTNTPLPEWESGDNVDSFSAKVKAVWPECLVEN